MKAGEFESSASGHRVTEEWIGQDVVTLADLLKPQLRAVCVGINPSPVSVEAGHYYQGPLGQAFYARLRKAGLITDEPGWEDDLAFANGIGFTDIVKRPTRSAKEVLPSEYAHGRPLLAAKLSGVETDLVIFPFKKAAEKYFGAFNGNGLIDAFTIGRASVFVMPGPYAPRDLVHLRLNELRRLIS